MTTEDIIRNILKRALDIKISGRTDMLNTQVLIAQSRVEIEQYAQDKVNEALHPKTYGIYQNVRNSAFNKWFKAIPYIGCFALGGLVIGILISIIP